MWKGPEGNTDFNPLSHEPFHLDRSGRPILWKGPGSQGNARRANRAARPEPGQNRSARARRRPPERSRRSPLSRGDGEPGESAASRCRAAALPYEENVTYRVSDNKRKSSAPKSALDFI